MKARLGPSPGDLVIVSRALADLADALRFPQEASGRGRVILDRRVSERRRAAQSIEQDRRQSDRRRPPTIPAEALLRVLGFMVVPTAEPGNRSTARPRVKPPTAKSGGARQPDPRSPSRRGRA